MPGTSKISDYIGFRCPKPLVADMKRIVQQPGIKLSLSSWMIAALSQAVAKSFMVTTPDAKVVAIRFTDAQYEVVARRAKGNSLSPGDYLKWLSTRSHHK